MLRSRIAARACSAALAFAAFPPGCEAALTGANKLSAVYELILSAQFTQADAQLMSTCPPALVEACRTLEAVSLWWQIQIDPDNRSRDQRFNERARAAVK